LANSTGRDHFDVRKGLQDGNVIFYRPMASADDSYSYAGQVRVLRFAAGSGMKVKRDDPSRIARAGGKTRKPHSIPKRERNDTGGACVVSSELFPDRT
jgi:hypothetical protein